MITDDMIKQSKALGNHKGFFIIDDDYILISDGEGLSIPKSNRLWEKGVNYFGPVECRFVDEKYYYMEHRAKGQVLQYSNYNLPSDKDIDFTREYLNAFKSYMAVLKKLSSAPQEQYIKFFSDIEEMRKENLKPDVCSMDNLLYDNEKGFCFIDAYPGDNRIKVKDIFHIILNDRFRAFSNYTSLSVLPHEYKSKYFDSIEAIISKVLVGLKEYDYPVEEIKEFLEQNPYNFSSTEIVKEDEIGSKFKEKKSLSNGWDILI